MNLKEQIVPVLINTEKNEKMLLEVPHKDIMDFSVMYRFVKKHGKGYSSAVITHEVLRQMNLMIEELDAIAFENAHFKFPLEMVELRDDILLVTGKDGIFGARAIFEKELLDKLHSRFGEDFYIIPVSIHEVMAVPVSGYEPGQLKKMLDEVNCNCISKAEFLSDRIYIYTAAVGEIERVRI